MKEVMKICPFCIPVQMTLYRCLVAVIGVLAVVVFVAVVFQSTPDAPAPQAEYEARMSVSVVCENAVKQRFRAPSHIGSGGWPSPDVKELPGSRFRLASYVDAENEAGETVRTNFVCIAEGSGEDYEVVELTVR